MAIDFPSSPTTGQTVTVGSKTWVYDGAKWNSQLVTSTGPTGPQGASANRNVIINGAMDIWQRGTSFTNLNGTYTADRWLVGKDGGTTVNVTQQAFTPGAAPVSGYEGQYFMRLAGTVSADNTFYAVQRIEDVRTLAGQTATLSYWAKSNVPANNYPLMVQAFGSGGSASVVISSPVQVVGTSWQRYSTTFTVPSITGKTVGSSSVLEIQVIRSNTSANIDVWGVQLEAGSTSTTFQRNAPSLQAELAACQRYYWRQTSASASDTYYGFATGFANSTTSAWISPFFPVQMRVAPAFASSAASTFQMFNNGGIINATSTALGRSGVTSATINIGAASGLVANSGLTFEARNTASAYLEFSAEL